MYKFFNEYRKNFLIVLIPMMLLTVFAIYSSIGTTYMEAGKYKPEYEGLGYIPYLDDYGSVGGFLPKTFDYVLPFIILDVVFCLLLLIIAGLSNPDRRRGV